MQNGDTRMRCLYGMFAQQNHTLCNRKQRSNCYSQGGLKALQQIILEFFLRKVSGVSKHIMFCGSLASVIWR